MSDEIKTPEDYQKLAARTRNMDLTNRESSAMLAMGLAGEAGEVTDYLKKVLFHDHDLELDVLEKEMGDVLWYLANLASEYNTTLTKIMQKNVDKLRERYPDGFKTEDSKRRKEYEEQLKYADMCWDHDDEDDEVIQ